MTANQLSELKVISDKLKKKKFRPTTLNDGELEILEGFLSSDFPAFLNWLQEIKSARDAKRKKPELSVPLTFLLPINAPATLPTPERKAAIEQLCLKCYKAITVACLADERLTPDDASLIFGDLETSVASYAGELNKDAFQQWALKAIKPLAEFYSMRREHWRAVYKGAWSIIRNATDLGFDEDTIRDIESDVWQWVLFSPDSPLIPNSGEGKISTRLYGKARWLARAWKTSRLRSKTKHIGIDEAERLETADNQCES